MLSSTLIRNLVTLIIIILSSPVSGADDELARAASLIKAKDYTKAATVLSRTQPTPQRSFMLATIALRQGNAIEASKLFNGLEVSLPVIADYAILYQAEALFKQKNYKPASKLAASIASRFPASNLLRPAHKLAADSLYQSGDYTAALHSYQSFVETYHTGIDTAEALFGTAQCRENSNDTPGALKAYRTLWLQFPLSPKAKTADDKRVELEKKSATFLPYTTEELLKRAETLSNSSNYTMALQTLEMINKERQTPYIQTQIDIKTGKAFYRARNRKQAEKLFAQALEKSPSAALTAEAKYWQAQALERLDQDERAFSIYISLISDNKKHEFVDDSIMAAAAIRKGQGRYREAIALYDRVANDFPHSSFLPRSRWESSWSRYLGGDFESASEHLKQLLADSANREKALYWLARSMQKQGKNREADIWYDLLLKEYTAGFYATWYRMKKQLKDPREPLGTRYGAESLPLIPGFEKPRLLASLGLSEEARAEMRAIRKKIDDRKETITGIARIYLEMEEYGAAIAIFQQNPPKNYEQKTMPFWSAGYPLAYSDLVIHHTNANNLSTGLIYGLMRAESAFNPSVRSSAGALGLMQLMPETAKLTAHEKGHFNPNKLLEPAYNIMLGTRHFKDLLKGYDGEEIYSIAAYNAGANSVARWRKAFKGLSMDEFIENIPYQETRDYVKKVYASAATYRQLYGIK